MSINLKIEKKDLWFLSAIIVFLLGVMYVVAYGGTQPADMGHSINEIERCAEGKILKVSGGLWVCSDDNTGAGGGDITDVNGGNGLTPNTCSSGSCTLDVSTGAAATTGLEIVSDQVRLMDDGCVAGEVLKRNAANTGWVCESVVENSFAACATTLGSSGCSCSGSTEMSRQVTSGTCTAVSDAGQCSSSGCSSCFPTSYQGTCCVCKP